jgi:hypothetical protein
MVFFFSTLMPLFCLADRLSAHVGPSEAADVPASTPVSPVSGDKTLCQIFSLFTSSFIMAGCLICFFYYRYRTGRRETRLG